MNDLTKDTKGQTNEKVHVQRDFAAHVVRVLEKDPFITGIAAGGSWLDEMDEYSDLDLILIVNSAGTPAREVMFQYAQKLGRVLGAFTSEHVGEPRLLICLYDEPLLHVDLKFLTLAELQPRVETPAVLFDRDGRVTAMLTDTTAQFPHPDPQWIEDRFWIWVHYALVKVGRGEYFEALEFLSFLRQTVLGPLLLLKNGQLPKGVRRLEWHLNSDDLGGIKATVASLDQASLLNALSGAIKVYRGLRDANDQARPNREAEQRVMIYFDHIRQKVK